MGICCPVKSNYVNGSYNFELMEIFDPIQEISMETDDTLQTKQKFICGWRLKAHPDIEVRLSKGSQKVFYSLYDHVEKQPLGVPISSRVLSIFKQCIWEGSLGNFESRLFKDDAESAHAILVSVDLTSLKIRQHIWKDYPNDFLKEYRPKISMNREGAFELGSERIKREQRIFTWYEPQAEEGMIRKKEKEGESEEGYLETTLTVWSSGPEVRLIKRTFESGKKDLVCSAFNRKKNQSIPIQMRLDNTSSMDPLEALSMDQLPIIQSKTLPVLELTKVGTPKWGTFYQIEENNPVLCFMKGADLCVVGQKEVEDWVQSQFCYGGGCKYEGRIRAKKIVYSLLHAEEITLNRSHAEEIKPNHFYNPYNLLRKRKKSKLVRSIDFQSSGRVSEEKIWEVSLYHPAGPLIRLSKKIGGFFSNVLSEIFGSRRFQIHENQMKELIAGVPMSTEDRDQAVNDFNRALANWATIIFRISCKRSYSGLELSRRESVLFITGFGESIRNLGVDVIQSLNGNISTKSVETTTHSL